MKSLKPLFFLTSIFMLLWVIPGCLGNYGKISMPVSQPIHPPPSCSAPETLELENIPLPPIDYGPGGGWW